MSSFEFHVSLLIWTIVINSWNKCNFPLIKWFPRYRLCKLSAVNFKKSFWNRLILKIDIIFKEFFLPICYTRITRIFHGKWTVRNNTKDQNWVTAFQCLDFSVKQTKTTSQLTKLNTLHFACHNMEKWMHSTQNWI